MTDVTVIGGGLAGTEASWQLANRGCKVELVEMRPEKTTPAHTSHQLAELVCSNSLGASNPDTAPGLLKDELRELNSIIMDCADKTTVPAGGALAVDRSLFSQMVTDKIMSHPNIKVTHKVWDEFPKAPAIIASGPLTHGVLAQEIKRVLGDDMLFFFDAASPIIHGDSIDTNKVFSASRYGKGGDDYLNCPMDQDEYFSFYENLIQAQGVKLKDFEADIYFEHCLPVEVMAKRGPKTLTFGPLKPVGLEDPKNGKQPYAVVQLRKEDAQGELYNMVGFQTNLTWGEQKRVFRMIPGLENAEFARFGVMHRNSYINSPKVMEKNFALTSQPLLYIAGQLSGVEGYLESTASGLVAGLDLWAKLNNQEITFPLETVMGSLSDYVTRSNKNFQPMNANFGLLPPIKGGGRRQERRKRYAERGRKEISLFAKNLNS